MTSICDLHKLAHDLGVELRHHDKGPLGWYSHTQRTISTRRGLAVWDYKSALAHELGHATYGDERTPDGRYTSRQERRADLFAARLLIDPGRLVDLAQWHRDDHQSLAADLEVTPHLLRVYIDAHPTPTQRGTAA